MLSLAFLLFKVEHEADIFYLYIGVYILQQRPPVFAYCNPLFLVGCVCGRVRVLVEGLTVCQNLSLIDLICWTEMGSLSFPILF